MDCRFGFSKLPSWRTLIAKPLDLQQDEAREKIQQFEKILKKVKEAVNDKDLISKVLSNPVYDLQKENTDKALYEKNREFRIKELLTLIGLDKEQDWNLYLEALQYNPKGFSMVMARDLDEIDVNSYNPEWTLAWNGNLDLQLCLDYFSVITYVNDYFTKDDTGTMNLLRDANQNTCSDTVKEKMKFQVQWGSRSLTQKARKVTFFRVKMISKV